MIVSLTVRKNIKKNWLNRFIAIFMGNKIKIETKKVDQIEFLHTTITQRRKKISWKKLYKKMNGNTKEILCRREITLSKKDGFSRYSSPKLNINLCKNTIIKVLETSKIDPQKLKISLFDQAARHCDIVKLLVPYSNQVNVVTKKTGKYIKIQEEIMEQFGATVMVSDHENWLFSSHLVIAPDKITVPLQLKQNTLLFTGQKSFAPLKGIIYDKYKVQVPELYKPVIPADLEPEYFLSAVYEKYHPSWLTTLSPSFCLSNERVFSVNQIISNLRAVTGSE